jgi:hypothetical protein
MPESRSTEEDRGAPAADTDVPGEAARNRGTMDGWKEVPANGGDPGQPGDAAPGIDENQAGFVKDPDKRDRP